MISKQEIRDLAWEFSLDPNTVEKDYVLGWLLKGISQHPQLHPQLIFKGGTCLKKCYFETYRFSEDLDYTLIGSSLLDERTFHSAFQNVAEWIHDEVGIEIPPDTIRFKTYRNRAGRGAIQGKLGYIGPMQRRRDPVRIRLDLSADEVLVREFVARKVHHPYSDHPAEGIQANCYCFPEIFAEKIRALSERARPRDLYDVIHLYRHATPTLSPQEVLSILQKKCEYKGIPVPTLTHIESHSKLSELESEWANMLAHQLPALPSQDFFWKDLPPLFSWLYRAEAKPVLPLIPLPEDTDLRWHPPFMISSWGVFVPLELLRYAAANQLCVELKDSHKTYLIEPYALKKTRKGSLFLISLKHNVLEEILSFQADHIKELKVTQIPFTPRYQIELTPYEE